MATFYQNKQTALCSNCGSTGHTFRYCIEPVSSYGVLVFRWLSRNDTWPQLPTFCKNTSDSIGTNSLIPQVLMIQRKDSLGFMDIMRGKYKVSEPEYIKKQLRGMTREERKKLETMDVGNFQFKNKNLDSAIKRLSAEYKIVFEVEQIDNVKAILATAEKHGVDIVLPIDVVVADKFAADAKTEIVSVDQIPDGWMGLDIGPQSITKFVAKISDAKTIVWNGPMGVFEMPAFESGTKSLALAITKIDAMTVVGGGDSAAAIRLFGIADSQFSHVSTGGGASLEFLEGKKLPGITVLEDN
jgi:hypothetical protein